VVADTPSSSPFGGLLSQRGYCCLRLRSGLEEPLRGCNLAILLVPAKRQRVFEHRTEIRQPSKSSEFG